MAGLEVLDNLLAEKEEDLAERLASSSTIGWSITGVAEGGLEESKLWKRPTGDLT